MRLNSSILSKTLLAALVASTLLLTPAGAFAWGERGHRLIGDIAYQRLTPEAKAGVDSLLAVDADYRIEACPVNTLGDAAHWADCVRDIPAYGWLSPLHYDNQPLCGGSTKAQYCANGKCATETIKKAIVTLKNSKSSKVKKLQALELLAHLTGDIHQPLHAVTNNDAGGNAISVRFDGAKVKLHSFWDTRFLVKVIEPGQAGLSDLTSYADMEGGSWTSADPDAWAAESFGLARSFVYARLPAAPVCGAPPADVLTLEEDYLVGAKPLVRQRLAQAGVRLADTLNAIFQ